jgi:hypothetical protein
MAEQILKGVFKEGTMVASVVQKDESAKIMLKGAEPASPGDPAFAESLKRTVAGCREHIEKFADRELCAVLVQRPEQAEHITLGAEDLSEMGLTRLTLMDGTCGLVVRVIEAEPAPTPLAYTSLRSESGLPDQPGLVDIPAPLVRKTHKDLTDPQKKVFEAAVQVAGRGLVRAVCVDDSGLKMIVAVKDAPPPRARSVLVPLGDFANDLARGTSLEEIAKRLSPLRT